MQMAVLMPDTKYWLTLLQSKVVYYQLWDLIVFVGFKQPLFNLTFCGSSPRAALLSASIFVLTLFLLAKIRSSLTSELVDGSVICEEESSGTALDEGSMAVQILILTASSQ